jgi:hypothetical protein
MVTFQKKTVRKIRCGFYQTLLHAQGMARGPSLASGSAGLYLRNIQAAWSATGSLKNALPRTRPSLRSKPGLFKALQPKGLCVPTKLCGHRTKTATYCNGPPMDECGCANQVSLWTLMFANIWLS